MGPVPSWDLFCTFIVMAEGGKVWAVKVCLGELKYKKDSLKTLMHKDLEILKDDSIAYIPLCTFLEGAVHLDLCMFIRKRDGSAKQPEFPHELYGDVLILHQIPRNPDQLRMLFPRVKLFLLLIRTKDDGLRTPEVQVIWQDPSYCGYASIKQNGIVYTWDPFFTMFCSGNITEKLRMAKMDMMDERVLDLYAGIGYWTLIMLKYGRAKEVYACDWNPKSTEYLVKNLELNGMSGEKCVIFQGDNRTLNKPNYFDRVVLGLLPSSMDGLPVAIKSVRKEVGVSVHLHFHQNVREGRDFETELLTEIHRLLTENLTGMCWDVYVVHRERVKSFAPRVYHWVFDIVMTPR